MCVKRGTLKAHHFAHALKRTCEHWTEPMTEWHRNWQMLAPKECREIRLHRANKLHIADIQLPCGLVVEVQHSPISVSEVHRREDFYDNMVWIVDGTGTCELQTVYDAKVGVVNGKGKQWWWEAKKPVLVDTGSGLAVLSHKKIRHLWVCVLLCNTTWAPNIQCHTSMINWLQDKIDLQCKETNKCCLRLEFYAPLDYWKLMVAGTQNSWCAQPFADDLLRIAGQDYYIFPEYVEYCETRDREIEKQKVHQGATRRRSIRDFIV